MHGPAQRTARECCCTPLLAAATEALEEAEKIADDWPAECLEGDGEQNCGPGIAAALAALEAALKAAK